VPFHEKKHNQPDGSVQQWPWFLVMACCLAKETTNTINQATATHMLLGAKKEQ